eukprot:7383467-Prymnesium_polylepis.1
MLAHKASGIVYRLRGTLTVGCLQREMQQGIMVEGAALPVGAQNPAWTSSHPARDESESELLQVPGVLRTKGKGMKQPFAVSERAQI